MKQAKKLFALLVVLSMLLVACSGAEPEPTPVPEPEPTEAPAEEEPEEEEPEEEEPAEEEPEEEEPEPTEEPAAEEEAAPSGDKVQVRWFVGLGTGSDAAQQPVQEQVVADFNASQDNIELVLEVVDNDQASDILNTQIAAGNPPDVVGPMGIAGRAAFPGAWLDLDPLIDSANYDLSDFDPALVEFYNLENEGQLGIPFAVFPSFMFVNQDLFDEAGLAYPPQEFGAPYIDENGEEKEWNMETLREIAQFLTVDENGNDATSPDFDPNAIVQFGFGNQFTDLRGRSTLFGAGNFVDGSGNAIVPDHWRTAIKWYHDAMWVDNFHPNKTYGDSDLFGAGNWFESGNVAMAYVHLWYATCCMGGLEAGWDTAVAPSYDGQTTAKMHADTFSILKGSDNPEEAFEVLSYLLGEQADELTQLYGGMPARLSLQGSYFDKLDASEQFADQEINWDVVVASMAYPDNPNHEEGMPSYLEATQRYGDFDLLLNSDPDMDIDAELDTLEADLQAIFEASGEEAPAEEEAAAEEEEEVAAEEEEEEPAEEAAASGDKVQVRWFVGLGTGSDAAQQPVQEQVVADFNASQDNIELVLEVVDNDQASDILNTQIAAGNPPDVVGPMGIAGRAAFPGAWLDLDPLIDSSNYDLSDFDPALVEFYNLENEGQLGIPFAVFPSFMFVNKELFDEAGLAYPPQEFGAPYIDENGDEVEWNMEALRDIAMFLTVDENGNDASSPDFDPNAIVQFGFGNQFTDLRGRSTLFGAGNFVDGSGNAIVPDHWRTAIKWYHDAMWVDNFHPNKTYGDSDLFGAGNWFESGNVAMAYVHLWYATCCMGGLEAGWDTAVAPSYDGQTTAKMHADTFSILKGSDNPEEAFEVLSYLLGEQADELTQLYGGMPARLSLQGSYFDKLDASEQFADQEINWDVVVASMAYPDNPNHEEGMPSYLEATQRYGDFDLLLNSDPDMDIDAELDTLEADLQAIFEASGEEAPAEEEAAAEEEEEVAAEEEEEEPAEEEAASGEQVQVRWFVGLGTGSDAAQQPVQEQVVADFNASQDNIELVLEVVDNDQASDILNTQIAAGNPPDVVGPMGIAGRAAFPGAWLDLDPLIDSSNYDLSDFDPALVEFYNLENEGQLGIPFAVFPSFMFVNKELFDEAGLAYPPQEFGAPYIDENGDEVEWNMETLRDIAMFLTVDENGNDASSPDFDPNAIVQFGFGNQFTDLRGRSTLFGAGNFVDGSGNAIVPDHWRSAIKWYHDAMWVDNFHPNKTYGDSDLFGAGNWFESGNVAMAYVHLWYATCCMGGLEAGWDTAVAPSYDGQTTAKMHADTFSILKGSDNPEEAFEVLSYLLGEQADELTQLYGGMPARLSLQGSYFDKLDASEQFADQGINWDVVVASMAYPDNPNHEEGMPSYLEATQRYGDFDLLLNSDPDMDIDAELDTLEADLQGIFDASGEEPSEEAAAEEPAEEEEAMAEVSDLTGELEIFSWWTNGGEADGLNAMYEIFGEQYPDVEIINATVAGGAGSNAKAVLATRMQSGDPPGSFQVHAGHELIDTWVVADKMEPVTFIFEENGWLDSYPEGVIDILSDDGEIWSVPVNIHRSNVLWYNKAVFEDNGLEVPTTFDEFFSVAEELQAAGVTPLALGDNGIWASTHLIESVLLGTLGPEGYNGLWTGETDWNSAEVTEALDNFARMVELANEDHAALSWDQAAQLVADGDAAMTIMGDWAQGYFTSLDLTADVEYGWAPAPGTDGVFLMLSDTFGLPEGAPDRDAAVAWLTVAGSKAGQDAFNPLKGSIPARTDGDRDLYDIYLQSAMDDFASNDISPSLAHGAAASEGWVTGFNDVMTLFVSDLDVEGAQAAMAQACEDADVCGAEGAMAEEEEAMAEVSDLTGELEIFSWWTNGGEADGLNAMYEVFGEQYPDVEIINATVAGGAGSNAKAVLATRMQSGDPPGSFQVHAGHELIDTWVVADKMEPVTFIFEENGWLDSYPEGVIDILSDDGEIWSVPVNIHRSNVLWYNKAVFDENGLEVPTSFDEFFSVAEELSAAGVTPLALGDNGIWASTHLIESVLLGTLGPDGYNGLWTGETDWNSAEVTEALENFAGMVELANEDHAALSWDQAAQLVADGDAAMTIMGDWAQGYFTSLDLTADVEYGWAPAPGTDGIFLMLSDTFGLPEGAPDRDAAVAWLTVAGSKEGQDAFNPLKGSIPARTDGDRGLYDIYLQSAMDDFASNDISPSLAHGAAASEGWVTGFNDVMTLFVSDLDVEGAQAAMAQACEDAGVCQ